MKKGMIITLTLIFSLVLQFFSPVEAQASKKTKAFNAYYKLIKKLHDKGDDGIKFSEFSLIYLNNDNIPELVALYLPEGEFGGVVVYTYYRGKTMRLFEYAIGRSNVGYINKSGKFICVGWSNGSGGYNIYKMKKGKLLETANFEWRYETDGSGKCHYKYNGKSVSKKTYEKKLKKAFDENKTVWVTDLKRLSYNKMRKKLKGKKSPDNTKIVESYNESETSEKELVKDETMSKGYYYEKSCYIF